MNFPATSQRQISSSASFCSAFNVFDGGVKSVSQASSSGVSGSSQTSRRPVFSRRKTALRETEAFARSRSRGMGAPVAARASRIFSSAAVEAVAVEGSRIGGIPGDDFLRARFAMAHDVARHEIALTNELFGGGCTARNARDGGCFERLAGFFEVAQKFALGAFDVRQFGRREQSLQMGAARFGERVLAVVAHFNFRREHGAKRFADGRKVVAADPVAELDEFRRQRRDGIEHFGDFFHARFHARRIGRLRPILRGPRRPWGDCGRARERGVQRGIHRSAPQAARR